MWRFYISFFAFQSEYQKNLEVSIFQVPAGRKTFLEYSSRILQNHPLQFYLSACEILLNSPIFLIWGKLS